jgi:hypothetical protein
MEAVTIAAFARDKGLSHKVPMDAELEAWVEAYRHAEERIASAIGAARAAAEVQQRQLPVLLAERMQVGDLIADGVNMAAGPYTRATVIQPQLWA